jgi:lantibiotic modifying enzyme
MYKPRRLAADLAWQRALSWLGRRAAAGPFLVPRILARRGYGWMEAVRPRLPATEREANRFHRRAGTLLALFDVLEVRDVHRDNLIAVGSHPVLVDGETIAHPKFSRLRGAPSLVLTGYLASPDARDDRAGMTAGLRSSPAGAGAGAARADRYTDQIVAGYRDGYQILRERGAELLARGGPLARLAAARTRVVLRPTEVYRAALASASGALPPGTPPLPLRPAARALVAEAERRALARGDVPVFHARPGGTDLLAAGKVLVTRCFQRSAIEVIARRLDRLGRAEDRRMTELIRAALALDGLRRDLGTGARGRAGRRRRSR